MLILNLVLAMAEDGGTAKAQLDAVMQGNFVAVTALQPLLADPAAFAAERREVRREPTDEELFHQRRSRRPERAGANGLPGRVCRWTRHG